MYPRALPAPSGPVTVITDALVEQAIEQSRRSPRGRMILPFHPGPGDLLNRMLNAMQPGSYVRPHRHLDPPKSESFLVLRGRGAFITFHDDGRPAQCLIVASGTAQFGVDVGPGVYHGFVVLAADTVIFEAKTGPYDPSTDKDFAPWAPEEGSPQAACYLERLQKLVA